MKKAIHSSLKIRRKILITLGVAFTIAALLFAIIGYIYETSVEQCYENLFNQTALVKKELVLQTEADSEQIKTIANFASEVFETEAVKSLYGAIKNNTAEPRDFAVASEAFAPIFNAFRRNGLIDELEILIPGDVMITASGFYDVSEFISFTDTVKLGEHISDVRRSYISEKKEVIHNAVPIIHNAEVVAILMGVVEVDKLGSKYENLLKYDYAHMHLIDGKTGDFIFNSDASSPKGVNSISASDEAKANYLKALKKGGRGTLEYKSLDHNEFVFLTYDSLGINDWRVVVAMHEADVFSAARVIIRTIAIESVIIVILMALYIWFIMVDERKRLRLSLVASSIRKLLLEFGQRDESVIDSLKMISDMVNARTVFFLDTDKDEYSYVKRECNEENLTSEDRCVLVELLTKYADNKKREIFVKEISFDEKLKDSDFELYSLMKSHNISTVTFAVIWDKNNHAGTICVVNGKNGADCTLLLRDIAMCFFMAVYNRKYLSATEQAAITDTLTGLTNRTGFNRDVHSLKLRDYRSLVCVYIDVNELHSYNNKYGHIAGDNMLVYIARAIENEFEGQMICRWGGDEFIVFAENITEQDVIDRCEAIKSAVSKKKYHVSIGHSFTDTKKDIELMLNEAEKRMYEAKARYYQDKSNKVLQTTSKSTSHISHVMTGNVDIDATLSIMSKRYYGVYAVSLDDDSVRAILNPDIFDNFIEEKQKFSNAMEVYISSHVSPDYHRAFDNFMNYDLIRKTLNNGEIPRIVYRKLDGEEIILTVHTLDDSKDTFETLWVFEKS